MNLIWLVLLCLVLMGFFIYKSFKGSNSRIRISVPFFTKRDFSQRELEIALKDYIESSTNYFMKIWGLPHKNSLSKFLGLLPERISVIYRKNGVQGFKVIYPQARGDHEELSWLLHQVHHEILRKINRDEDPGHFHESWKIVRDVTRILRLEKKIFL